MAGRFATAYVFRFENMRNATLKELRDKLHGSARCALGCATHSRRLRGKRLFVSFLVVF